MPNTYSGIPLVLILLVFVSQLSACSDAAKKTTEDIGVINGVVSLGPVSDARVSAYSYSNGSRGPLLSSTSSDGTGNYELRLQAPSGPVLLEVIGGTYIEEASGTQVYLAPSQTLLAVVNFEEAERQEAMLTPFTTLAAGVTAHQIDQGVTPAVAIELANQNVSSFVGFNVQKIEPKDITSESNRGASLDDGVLYGLFNAAISQLTLDKSTPQSHDPTSAMFAEYLYDDIRSDGFLNGKRDSEVIQIGKDDISVDTYRQELAQSLLAISSSTNNLTAVNQSVIKPYAQNLAAAISPLFEENISTGELDTDAPVFTPATDPPPTYQGAVNLQANVTDPSGVKSVEFFLRDDDATNPIEIPLGTASDLSNPSIAIDTTNTDQFRVQGNYTIIVLATDIHDNGPARTEIPFVVSNTQSSVSITSSLFTNQADYTITGTINNLNRSTIQSVDVDGATATITDGQFSAPVTLSNGGNTFSIRITDSDQVVNTQDVVVTLDTKAPRIGQGNIGSNACKTNIFHFRPNVSDESGLASVRIQMIQGDNITNFIGPEDINLPNVGVDTKRVTDGQAILRVIAVDNAGNEGTNEFTFTVDNTGPQINVTSAATIPTGKYILRGRAVTSGCAAKVRVPILVDSQAAAISSADGTFEHTFDSITQNRTIEIIATDERDNSTTLRFNLTVN